MAKKHFQRKPPLKLFQRTVGMHFRQTWRYFSARKQDFFVWKSESDKQNSTTFLQKIFNSKNASGHEDCSSDNPVKKLSDKIENLPLNVGTRKCKVFIGKFFCSTCSHVHLESSFDNPVEEFVTKCRWFSAQHLKTLSIFFTNCCYGHVEGSFDNLNKKVSTKSRKHFDQGPKKNIIKVFFKI